MFHDVVFSFVFQPFLMTVKSYRQFLLANLPSQEDFDRQICWEIAGTDPVPFNWGVCASLADIANRPLPVLSPNADEVKMRLPK